MDGSLHPVQIPDIAPDKREILRYAMLPSCAEMPEDLPLEECLALSEGKIRCRAVWKTFPLSFSDSGLNLGFASVSSAALRRHLEGIGQTCRTDFQRGRQDSAKRGVPGARGFLRVLPVAFFQKRESVLNADASATIRPCIPGEGDYAVDRDAHTENRETGDWNHDGTAAPEQADGTSPDFWGKEHRMGGSQ